MHRKVWIDMMRGISMMAILLFHTEMYYAGHDIISYNFYVANSLCAFYFLSGYLFYNEKEFKPLKKLRSIARGLVIPYFIFTLLIAVPKALAHGNSLAPEELLMPILTGTASWFVASLIIAELVFTLLLHITHKWNLYVLPTGIVMLIIAIAASESQIADYWNWKEGLLAVFYLSLGYLFHKNEEWFEPLRHTVWTTAIFILFLILKITTYHIGVNMVINNISNYPLFVVDTMLGILFMISICKQMHRMRLIEWTGRASLYYYFLCGGVPLLVGRMLNKIGAEYNGNYMLVMFAFLLVYVITTSAVWIIQRITLLTHKSTKLYN